MSENPSTASEIHFRFLPSVFPLSFIQKTLTYRRFGNIGFVDLATDSISDSIFERLKTTGLSQEELKEAGLHPLLRAGLIEASEYDSDPPLPAAVVTTHDRRTDAVLTNEALKAMSVEIISLLRSDFETPFSTLSRVVNQFEVRKSLSNADASKLYVVFAPRYDDPRIEPIAAELRSSQARWILVQIESNRAYFGPMFGDRAYPHCFHCFRARVESSLEFNRLSPDESGAEFLPALISWTEFRILQAASARVAENPSRTLISFDPLFNKIAIEHYLPAPLCDVCG